MISIIVPIYNAEQHISECIESVLNQLYTDFELILINDGSTDNSDFICKSYLPRDSRIRYIAKTNSGVGATRNLGLKEAKGKWICFIDADDVVKNDYLQSFNVDNTSADLVFTGIEFFDIQAETVKRVLSFENKSLSGTLLYDEIRDLLFVGFPYGKAYRKEIIEKYDIKFPEDISFHEDHVFVLDYWLHVSSIETSSSVSYVYNVDYSVNSLSKKKHPWERLNKSGDYMLSRMLSLKSKFGLSATQMSELYSFCYDPKISAVYALYDIDSNYVDKRNGVKDILYGKYHIKQYFFPKDKKGKLLKKASLLLPLPLFHLFLKGVNRYQHRSK